LYCVIAKKFPGAKATVTRLELTWSENLAVWLTAISPVLMGLGMLALFIEFKTPGFGMFGIAGIVLLIAIVLVIGGVTGQMTKIDHAWATFAMRWLHVVSGVLWIGLLWYLNFVQVPTMPSIPAEHRSAITGHIAPRVLFFFRYAALATVITGLLLAWMQGYILNALMFQKGFVMIGIGMWMATIMWFNVWFVIWPNQQKALNIGGKFPDLTADQKAKYEEAEAAFKKEADAWEKAHPNFKDEIKKAHEARDKDAIHKLMEQRKPVMESRKSAVEKLRASLTDEQKARLDKFHQEMQDKRAGWRDGKGDKGPKGPPPPPAE